MHGPHNSQMSKLGFPVITSDGFYLAQFLCKVNEFWIESLTQSRSSTIFRSGGEKSHYSGTHKEKQRKTPFCAFLQGLNGNCVMALPLP